MATPVKLLQLSPTMSEGTVVKWLVKEGDDVSNGQAIAEVETDKAVMEQESFEDGKILKLTVNEGDKVPVEGLIAVIGDEGEDISGIVEGGSAPAPKKEEPSAPKASSPPPATPMSAKTPETPDSKPASEPAPAKAASAEGPSTASGDRVLASPLARKMAADAGLQLDQINGSGPHGRVIKRDVEAAIESGPVPAAAGAPAPAAVEPTLPAAEEIPLSGMRQTIARRLVESKQLIPHFQLTIDIRAEKLESAVKQIRAQYPDNKVTITHFIIKAMAAIGMRHKPIRSQWAGDHLHVVDAMHVSVAVAIDEGLVTPVIRNAHTKGVLALASELRELAGLARDRKLKPEDMTGGTQTISNLGMYGINNFTAIINPPETSILAVGATEDRPVVENGQIVPGRVFTVTMSSDHRVIDGAVGAAYLADLKKALEDPLMMLL